MFVIVVPLVSPCLNDQPSLAAILQHCQPGQVNAVVNGTSGRRLSVVVKLEVRREADGKFFFFSTTQYY